MFDTLRKAVSFLDRTERRRWLVLIPVALIAAALESVAALSMLWLIRLLIDPMASGAQTAAAASSGHLPSGVPFSAWLERTPPAWFAVLVALLFIGKNALRVLESYARAKVAADSAARIGTRLLRGYLRAPWDRHLGWNSALLIRNTTVGVDTVCSVVLTSATAAASELLGVLAILAVLVLAAPGRVLIVIAALGALVGLLLWLTQRSFERWGRNVHQLQGASQQLLQQTLGSTKVVKVLGRELFFERAFDTLRRSLAGLLARRAALASLPRLVLETVLVVAIALVIALAIGAPADAASWLPFMGFAAYAGLRTLPSVHLAVYHLNNVRFGKAAVEELDEHWSTLVAPPADTAAGQEGQRRDAPIAFERELVVDRATFVYSGESRPTLRDVSLSIRKGESVGVIGRTGSGKTTLVDLLLGLLRPTSGAVLVDGVDIWIAPAAWQRQVGYVPQETHLIDDTLRRNVALGIEDGEVVEDQLEEAVRLARLDDLVRRLPRGLETMIGERGVRLSGGERQRVAIARALYHRPAVLVFDEATAALDRQTESELQVGIDSLRGGKTLIVVAHRLATVRGCDRVIVLRDGRITDQGPLADLLARDRDLHRQAELHR